MGKRSTVRGVVFCAAIVLPGAALAHTVMKTPPPRDVGVTGNDGHKQASAPCGNVLRTQKYVQYEAGATIDVAWTETIDHSGCFQVTLSTDGDKTFQMLKQFQDDAGTAVPHTYTEKVTLPTGVTCSSCTLQVRQLMQGNNATCPANADPLTATNGTYYSCADICIGPTCTVPEAGVDASPDPTSSSSSSSTSTSSSSGASGDNNADPTEDNGDQPHAANTLGGKDGGCSTTSGLTTGAVFTAALTMLGLSVARRRREKKSQ